MVEDARGIPSWGLDCFVNHFRCATDGVSCREIAKALGRAAGDLRPSFGH